MSYKNVQEFMFSLVFDYTVHKPLRNIICSKVTEKQNRSKQNPELFQQHTFGSNIPHIIFLQEGLPAHREKGPPWIRTYVCCEFLVLWQILHWFDWDPFTCLTKPWLHNQWGSETLDWINFQVYLCCYQWIFCHLYITVFKMK